MSALRLTLALAISASLLSGCSTLKKFTGQRDDTILPGERENILSADQQVNPKPGKAGDLTACDPAIDIDCPVAVDQEAPVPEDIQ